MKSTYLKRAIIAGVIWAIMVIMAGIAGSYPQMPEWMLIVVALAGLSLAVILGKAIMETVSKVTGFTFFFSGIGLIMFYLILFMFSIIIAPLYCIWNLVRFFIHKEPA